MSCERFAEAITEHACGAALDEAARRHLAACAECRRVLEEQRRMLQTAEDDLRRALDVNVSAGFAVEAVRRAHAMSGRASSPYVWWMGAAAALLVLGIWMGVRTVAPTPPRDAMSSGAPAAVELPPRDASASAPAAAMLVPGTAATESTTRDEATDRKRYAAAAPRPASAASRERASARAREPANPRTHEPANARTREPANPRTREPEVIVPPTQARAIARLRELLAARVLDGATLPPALPLGGEPAPLTVAPLAVPEIVVPAVETTNDSGVAGEYGPREMELAQ